MADKVYEMDDDYKQAVADWLAAIKSRDELAEAIKLMLPEHRRESLRILAEMDKELEAAEALLASAYEAYQKFCRKEEEVKEMTEKIAVKLEEKFICIKHHLPDKLAEMEAKLFQGWSPENIQEFYDRVAIREATELEKILALNKEQ